MKYLRFFPFTLFCVALIWVLCLCTPPKTKLDEVENIDKFYHVAMYLGTMGLFWVEYWRFEAKGYHWSKRNLFFLSILLPIAMSGIIELVQAFGTDGRRSGDWLDFAANSFGVLLAFTLGTTILKYFSKKFLLPGK